MDTARDLTAALAALLRTEHDALAEFLVALADFDRRRLWVELGYSSLFYFLRRELRLSNAAAHYRKVAAELIQEIPEIIEPLRRGQLCLTSIIEAAKVVTAQNWETVLPRFYGLSRREAVGVVAELQPHPAPPLRTVVTPVRSAAAGRIDVRAPQSFALGEICEPRLLSEPRGSPSDTSPRVTSPGEVEITAFPPSLPLPVPPETSPGQLAPEPVMVEPLTAELSRLHVTVSKDLLRKLAEARDALSRAMPGATEAEILEAGLDLLLAQAAKRRGQVEKPQKTPRPSKDDHIPAHVRREVWKRDDGRCQYPLAAGGICGSTRNLELDHIQPRALGGTSTVDNLRVACRPPEGSPRIMAGRTLRSPLRSAPRLRPRVQEPVGFRRGRQGQAFRASARRERGVC